MVEEAASHILEQVNSSKERGVPFCKASLFSIHSLSCCYGEVQGLSACVFHVFIRTQDWQKPIRRDCQATGAIGT